MAERTGIEWTDATWNPVTGCTKVSQGCKNCYAERDWRRLSSNASTIYYDRKFTDVAWHPERLAMPAKWQGPRRIFVNSMSDLFHELVPECFIRQVFETMLACPQHTFQVLTKRTERMRTVTAAIVAELGPLPRNIHLGISAENQLEWDNRIGDLLRTPAAVRFVSLEPLLGQIDGRGRTAISSIVSIPPVAYWPLSRVDWVIVGGETGRDARPTNPRWVRWLRDQCAIAEVPFCFKQWGDWIPSTVDVSDISSLERRQMHNFDDGAFAWKVGKKAAGRTLDGRTWDERPRNAVNGRADQ